MDNRMYNWFMQVSHEDDDVIVEIASKCWYSHGRGKTFKEAFELAYGRTKSAYPVRPPIGSFGMCIPKC